MQISNYDLVVIGSRPAGQKCAIAVAKAGRASAEIVDARTPPPHHLIKQLTAGKTTSGKAPRSTRGILGVSKILSLQFSLRTLLSMKIQLGTRFHYRDRCSFNQIEMLKKKTT